MSVQADCIVERVRLVAVGNRLLRTGKITLQITNARFSSGQRRTGCPDLLMCLLPNGPQPASAGSFREHHRDVPDDRRLGRDDAQHGAQVGERDNSGEQQAPERRAGQARGLLLNDLHRDVQDGPGGAHRDGRRSAGRR
jgi:hypothetical protein